MDPKRSPNRPGTHLFGVRRVNDKPILIVGAITVAFTAVMAYVAYERSQPQTQRHVEENTKPQTSLSFAQEIAKDQGFGMTPPLNNINPNMPPLPGDQAIPIITSQDSGNLTLPPLGNSRGQGNNPQFAGADGPAVEPQLQQPVDPMMTKLTQNKLQDFEAAVKSPSSVPIANRALLSDNSQRDNLNSKINETRQRLSQAQENNLDARQAYQNRLASLQPQNGGGQMYAAAGQSLQGSNNQQPSRNDLKQFASNSQEDRWELNSRPQAPRTPYELRAGFVIPGTLISGINSELPGQIIAQVSQSVYDTPTGKYLLIPQGSRLVGAYANQIAYGQSRIFIAWQRIIFPDGKAMDIGAMPGADAAGYAGLNDQVDNHFIRLFGSAFLLSGITAGVTLSQQPNTSTDATNRRRTGDVLSEALGQQIGTTMAQVISKNLNISPTLQIRPGYRFNVMVIKDLTFDTPYQSFDYQSQRP